MIWLDARPRAALAVPVFMLALAGCDSGGDPAATAPPASPPAAVLSTDNPVRGELTTQSAMNMNDGSRYEMFDVTLAQGAPVRIALDSAFRGVLTLYRDGELIESRRSPACCDDERRPMALVHQAAGEGRYALAVSAADRQGYGPFRLEAAAIEAANSGPLPAGATVTGWLGQATPLRDRHRANVYDIEIGEPGLHEFTMRSGDVDAYLALRGEGISLEDDDGADNLDARITAFLQPGRYNLRAGVMDGEAAGIYTVAHERKPLPEGVRLQNGGALALDEEVMGSYAGSELNYELSVPERRRVVIAMRSEQIDSYLELRGPGVSLRDDDGGDNYDARLETTLEAGTYTVVASAHGGSGMFRLLAAGSEPPAAGGGDIEPGAEMEATLPAGRPDVYRLRVERAGRYVIDMRSQAIDAYLRLSGQGVDAEDDDGGSGYDARLALELEPGTYRLEASSLDDDGGVYRLSVRGGD